MMKRWCAVVSATIAAMVLACGAARAADKPLPIIFVHGNGDSAASWMTIIWRFESNGYPPELLEAIDLRYPLAGKIWDQPEPAHSTVNEATHQLAETVELALKRHHATKTVLIAHSRGGTIVRNYLKNAGGAAHTAIAILCGAPNHGVVVSDKYLNNSEFNGSSTFLRDLNGTSGEVVAGVRLMTIRSESNDKFAQPDGRFIGQPGIATGLGFDAPELKDATNLVIPRIDHRETAYGPEAFAAMYKFITGREPKTRSIRPEKTPVIEGKVSAFEEGAQTNIGVAGAIVEVYKVSRKTGERMGNALLRKVTSADGVWGPIKIEPKAYYEFILAVPGFAVTHIYRSPFPRSSRYVHLRPQLMANDDKEAGAVVYMSRPRGYFGLERDKLALDGKPPPGIASGVPSVSAAKLTLPATPQRLIEAVFNREHILARTWASNDNQVSVAEFTW
jgi:triacylglycerol lipase